MCGRFAITTARFSRIEVTLGTTFPEVRPRDNISPSPTTPIVRESADGNHELVEMRWGFVPHSLKEPQTAYSTFNALAETLPEKPVFRWHSARGGAWFRLPGSTNGRPRPAANTRTPSPEKTNNKLPSPASGTNGTSVTPLARDASKPSGPCKPRNRLGRSPPPL